MATQQELAELATFRRFAEVCPLAIDVESIENRLPPEPDIMCRLSSGEEIAFELVEIIDQEWARLTSGMFRDRKALRAAFDAASGEFRAALDARLHNALVYVEFTNDATSSQRRGAVPAILHQLTDLPIDFEGRWRPPAGTQLADVLRGFTISRGSFGGPEFDVSAASSIGEPTVDRIRTKYRRTYATTRPIELLAFYELQPLAPKALWHRRLESFVEASWSTAPFRRVWLFDVGSRIITYWADRSAEVDSAT